MTHRVYDRDLQYTLPLRQRSPGQISKDNIRLRLRQEPPGQIFQKYITFTAWTSRTSISGQCYVQSRDLKDIFFRTISLLRQGPLGHALVLRQGHPGHQFATGTTRTLVLLKGPPGHQFATGTSRAHQFYNRDHQNISFTTGTTSTLGLRQGPLGHVSFTTGTSKTQISCRTGTSRAHQFDERDIRNIVYVGRPPRHIIFL